MTIMFILVRLCIWVLGSYKLEALKVLMGSLEFALRIVANYCALVVVCLVQC